MEKIKFSSLLNVTDKDQNIIMYHFVNNIDTITIENGKVAKYEIRNRKRILETKTAECWDSLIKLNKVEDNYIEKIIPCKTDDTNNISLYIELE
jgi:hypothetical protein